MRWTPGLLLLVASVFSWPMGAGSGATGPVPGPAAGPVVEPRVVVQGGVAVVRWAPGETVPDTPEIRCMGRVVPMRSEGQGWLGVLGVDLAEQPGPRECELKAGQRSIGLVLEVRQGVFPEERLTLPEEMVSPKGEVLERIRRETERLRTVWLGPGEGAWREGFVMPLDAEVITPFGVRRILNGIPKSPHKGLDLRGKEGTAVRSMNRGRVVLAEDLYYGGLTVVVDHGTGIYSYYMHLSEASVAPGDLVARGDVIGGVGRSGRATGPHLHFGVKIAGANVNPESLVNAPLEGGVR